MARSCRMVIAMLALAVMNGGCIHAGLTATTISSSSEVNDCGEFYSGAMFAAIGPSPAGEFRTFGEGCEKIKKSLLFGAYATAYQQYAGHEAAVVEQIAGDASHGGDASYTESSYTGTNCTARNNAEREQCELAVQYCRTHPSDDVCMEAISGAGGAP